MKLFNIASFLTISTSIVAGTQWYPLDIKGEIPATFTPYKRGDNVYLDCISRNIDNGEHKFDEQDKIIYGPFPTCKETGKPLNFKYGISEDFNCTITFSDELYHLFQLYIHEDVPFSCRLPISSESHYLEQGGAYIPLTFNFRGEIHDSHLDIDPTLNVLITKPANNNEDENTFISAVAYSSGTNATRIVIGDSLTLSVAVRFLDQLKVTSSGTTPAGLPYAEGFYKFPINFTPISPTSSAILLFMAVLITGIIVFAATYNYLSKRLIKSHKYKSVDSEAFTKMD
ncbi:uncharacterized protein RJT21DRAFT_19731 [Scheffersomyces amazonensis]|uniref:uncharacterized protein n=1 Tax=Scheffersomyces amazonensis TaxID=1078765 RepID=UPI00315D769D